jgi:integrase
VASEVRVTRRSPGDGHIFKRKDGFWIGGVELPTTDGKRRQKRVSSKSRNDWLVKVHRYRVKPYTFPGDKRMLALHIKPHIGGKRLDRLTPQDVRNMLEQVNTSRNKQRAHQLLCSALEDAVKDGLVARNVGRVVDKPKHIEKEQFAFTPPVAIHIIQTADASCDEMWATRWAAGFMTGLRESELLGLEWDRVDLVNDRLDISWQLQELQKTHGCGKPVDGKYPCGKVRVSFCPDAHWEFPPGLKHRFCEGNLVWTPPKSQRSDRGLPITAPLHDRLERLQYTEGPNPHNLVFHHPDGRPITQSQDQKAWTRLLEIAEIPHARQHTLRRTSATLLRAAAVDEQTRMALFGHATVDVQRIYAGDDWELQKDAMDKLADIFTSKELT